MAFIVPLSSSEHRLASSLCKQQSSVQKAKQVYLNTLAVFAVKFYLRCMRIETSWEASLSWEPVAHILMDVADLDVTGLGSLECRPAWSEAESVEIPPEVWSNRIGYVVVQLDDSLREATLLGFSETVPSTGELRISSLRPLVDLLAHLHQLSQPEPMFRTLEELQSHLRQTNQPKPIKMQTNLSLWLQNVFENDWRSIEEFFGTNKRYLALRSDSQLNAASVRRAKLINLELYLENRLLTLVVIVTKEPRQSEVFIRVQVHPAGGEAYLPPNLKLALLSESGEFIGETISRSWGLDKYIQIGRIEGLPGECFNIQVAYGKARITESFLI